MELYMIGIDISKKVFELRGVNERGGMLYCKRLSRSKFMEFMVQQKRCIVSMETCAGSNYWGREFEKLGFTVRLIPGQFVKPYVKTNKNDKADAEAICEAALRPGMRFVEVKSVAQQDIQNLHRVRTRLVKSRTAVVNQIHGILLEYGIDTPKGIGKLCGILSEESVSKQLSEQTQAVILALRQEVEELTKLVDANEKVLKALSDNHPVASRLKTIGGVGNLTATAILAAVNSPTAFKNGRSFAAWVGLTPKQHSSGAKVRLLGTSKRGNQYLRTLFVNGANAELQHRHKRIDDRSRWLKSLVDRRGWNKAVVALANKNARIAWALMVNPEAKFERRYTKEAKRLAA